MSFNFSFIAKDRETALRILGEQHAPEQIKAYVSSAIEGLHAIMTHHNSTKPHLISVDANGHLCDGKGIYEVTTSKIEVKPLYITE